MTAVIITSFFEGGGPGDILLALASVPICRRSALHPGDFPVAGKVTKGAPRAPPFGIPPVRKNALFGAALTLAPGLLSTTKKDRFATLSR